MDFNFARYQIKAVIITLSCEHQHQEQTRVAHIIFKTCRLCMGLCHGLGVQLAGCQRRSPSSIPSQSMWDWQWTK